MNRAAVFLDRDGVINRNIYYEDFGEWESPRVAADVVLHAGSAAAIARLNARGYQVFIVSNQPSAVKGKTTFEALQAVDAKIMSMLAADGVSVTQRYYAYHHPDYPGAIAPGSLEERKPSPYFLHHAASEYGLDLAASWMIGDRDSDIECGLRAGVRTIAIAPDHPDAKQGLVKPHFEALSLSNAVQIILESTS